MDIYRTCPCSEGLYCSKVLYKGLLKNLYSRLTNKEIGGGTSNRIAANNQRIFIPKKISALLLALICVLTLAACGGGGDSSGGSPESESRGEIETKLSTPIGVSNLKIIPNVTNATLSWNNPDTNIDQISIIYQNTTANSFERQENITDNDSIRPNAKVTKVITGLTNGTSYIFNVLLELDDADENKRVVAEERTRQIGPNFDGDEEADAVDKDDDNDGINDIMDSFPRNKAESADLDNDTVGDNHDLCDYPGSSRNWRVGVDNAEDNDGDGCRGDGATPEDADDNDGTKYGFEVLDLRVIPDTTNATLIWNNPDINIAHINISYKLSTAADFEPPITITDSAKTARNATNTNQTISGLTTGTYIFNILLGLGGDDENRSVVTTSITRLIGPNLDGDEYADADSLELDKDGDGVNDERDVYPDDATSFGFAVTGLQATPGAGNVTLSWNNPAARIASINISYQRDGSTDVQYWNLITNLNQIETNEINVQETIDGLTNGELYTFNVSLTLKDADTGREVAVASVTATPDIFAVTELTAIPGIGNVTLSWNNPAANITSINISYHNASTPDVLQYLPLITNRAKTGINAKNVQQVITDLTNEEPYTFNVSLTLTGADAGREGAAASVTATPGIFAVIGLQATPGAGNVTLSWNNPSANISSINISYQRDGSNDVQYWDLITAPAQIEKTKMNVQETIDGLTNGESYTFNVSLTLDGADAGREGAAVSVTATPDIFSVIGLQAAPGAGNVILSWNNPFANISSINISYQRDGSEDVKYWDLITNPAQIKTNKTNVQETIYGLTNGELYTFNVSLTLDGADAGREGETLSITSTPDIFAVTGLAAIPNDRGITLSWNNPAANITSISISYQRDGSTLQESFTITDSTKRRMNRMNVQQVITDLTNEKYYNFTIDLTLGVDYASRKGAAPSIKVAIGPNLDGDEYADFVDDDENGDGVDDIDTDGDGIHDFRDPDANGNGRPNRDSDSDGIFDYLDTDDDNDTIPDEADVDDDGDGLMEIATAEQLNQTRHNLLGSSFKLSPGGMDNVSGCGAPLTRITECNGYELSNDISLADYDNWEPIGSCLRFSGTVCTPISKFFNTIFDGNGYIISNLTITNPVAPYTNASGLFGATGSAAVLHNIHISSANITGGENNVGMLVGYAKGSSISNSSAEGEVNASGSNVGGLVGYGSDAIITSSWTAGRSVSGGDYVGGLVGSWNSDNIILSYSVVQYVSGGDDVGGLAGYGGSMELSSSYATGVVSGDDYVGGLVGAGVSLEIKLCYVVGGSVNGTGDNVGGLVGFGAQSRITTSYAAGGSVSGSSAVGGLVGSGFLYTIRSSYAAPASLSKTDGSDIATGDSFGGLIAMTGFSFGPPNEYSYWDSSTSGITDGGMTDKQEPKTTAQLQNPINFVDSIYANWATDRCDDGSYAWDLGNKFQYPALTCPPGGVAPQR